MFFDSWVKSCGGAAGNRGISHCVPPSNACCELASGTGPEASLTKAANSGFVSFRITKSKLAPYNKSEGMEVLSNFQI